MARRHTFGERMVDWERERDENNWKNSFKNALSVQDYERIEELVEEGLSEGFDFPHIDDSRVLELIRIHS